MAIIHTIGENASDDRFIGCPANLLNRLVCLNHPHVRVNRDNGVFDTPENSLQAAAMSCQIFFSAFSFGDITDNASIPDRDTIGI